MLELSESQIKALDELAERNYHQRLLQHVQQCFPQQCLNLDEQVLHQRVNAILNAAKAVGLDEKRDILRFLNLFMILGIAGARVQTYPWVQEILERSALSAKARLLLLDRAVESHFSAQGAVGE